MILHVTADAGPRPTSSPCPRDLLVHIPRVPEGQLPGRPGQAQRGHGVRQPGARAGETERPQGFELLAKTVSKVDRHHAVRRGGDHQLQRLPEDRRRDGRGRRCTSTRTSSPSTAAGRHARGNCKPGGGGYLGPQAEYKKGTHHLKGWQALDYVRQRYGLPNGDYDRQRHQQQFVKAMVEPGVQQGRGDQPDQAGPGGAGGRQVADLQRAGAQRWSTSLSPCVTCGRTRFR